MISLRPSLIAEHHSVSSLNDLALLAVQTAEYLGRPTCYSAAISAQHTIALQIELQRPKPL